MTNYNIKSIKEDFKKKGIFYTPPELANLMKSYIDFEPKEVYDPTCGDGGLLCVFDDNVKKYGQEINEQQLEVAKERLVNFEGICGDTLKNPAFKDKKFELIMANPPFSIKWEPFDDERFNGLLAPKSRADYAFIQHIIYYLNENGTAIVLDAHGILFRGNKEGMIRKWIIDNNFIEKIINIPAKTFIDTDIPTVMVIFKKNKKTTDVEFEDRKTGKKEIVTIEKIKENDYNLNIPRYIDTFEPEEEIDIDEVQEELYEIDKQIAEVDVELNKYLKELGLKEINNV